MPLRLRIGVLETGETEIFQVLPRLVFGLGASDATRLEPE
jgi:hypothetical protein